MGGHLRNACPDLAECRELVWVNPDREEDGAIPWVEDGAKPDRTRMLGHRA